MNEKQRRWLDACFGGDYQRNKHKKEYAHIDLHSSAQSGIEAARQRKYQEKENNVNKILQSSIMEAKQRGVISEAQASKMTNVIR